MSIFTKSTPHTYNFGSCFLWTFPSSFDNCKSTGSSLTVLNLLFTLKLLLGLELLIPELVDVDARTGSPEGVLLLYKIEHWAKFPTICPYSLKSWGIKPRRWGAADKSCPRVAALRLQRCETCCSQSHFSGCAPCTGRKRNCSSRKCHELVRTTCKSSLKSWLLSVLCPREIVPLTAEIKKIGLSLSLVSGFF